MLSDRERETLAGIERSLCDEDPKFARTLEWPSAREQHRHVHTALMVIAAVLGVVALVLGHSTGALACALVAGWTWGVLQRRNRPEVRRSQVTD